MKRKKRKKKKNTPEEFQANIQSPQPIFRENGERDYFAEFYRSYKNDYIDQYLRAYRELKDLNAAVKKVDEENRGKKGNN